MKTYSEYKNEILPKELYDGLIGFGLFAEKIPGFLTSETFLTFSRSLTLPIRLKAKDYIRYSSMRNINIPRPLAIPEPFAYVNLCSSIASNWPSLQKHFSDKTKIDPYKVSRIHLRKMDGKSNLFEMNYKNFMKDGEPEQDIIIKSKYLALADISNCFPSIYSHSIPWALIGKKTSKNSRDKNDWFNQLDFHIRNVKYGETNGVLIGPHASNLIAEIILTSVDHELVKQGFNFIRNIDDYSCYVSSFEDAEKFFISLSDELKKYELVLNSKKSQIIPLPQASVKNWVTKLNHFNFTNTYVRNGLVGIRVKELKAFIDFAVELMLEEKSDASVLNYAIKIVSNKYLGANSKNYFEKQVHHLVLLYPYLIFLLEKDFFEAHKIDKKIIENIANDIYVYGKRKKLYEACSYAVYWAMKYDFKLNLTTLKADSIASLDCVFLLISFLYDRRHNRNNYLKEYKDIAKNLKRTDFDRYWIYIYETLPWTELSDNYRVMKKNNLSFVKNQFN